MKSVLRAPKHLTLAGFFLFLMACCSLSFGQGPLERLVQESGDVKMTLGIENARINSDEFKSIVQDYVLFTYDEESSRRVMDDMPKTIQLTVPTTKGDFNLRLVETKITSPDYRIESASGTVSFNKPMGVHYRGIVEGAEGSLASVSFFDGSISILASTKELGNFTVNKIESQDDNRYISYFDTDLKVDGNFACHTEDPESIPEFLQNPRMQSSFESRGGANCVRVHIEVDNDLFNNKGSVANAAAFLEGIYSQVAILYAAEDISTVISYMHVWDIDDSFDDGFLNPATNPNAANSSLAINSFQTYILQGATLNGDLGHLATLDQYGNGGVARGIGVLCLNDDSRLAYSDIAASYFNVPTYSWPVMVMTHEMGHNLGSPHTHGCYWNGNGTQIDDCGNVAGQTEGAACFNAAAPIIPAFGVGGTIMSYCHLNAVGIGLANGFGPQPGDLIRLFYNNAPCLSECPVSTTCVEPYQLLIESVTETTAMVSWYHETENNFEVEYGYDGAFSTMAVTGTSVTLTGLDAGKNYEVKVKTKCTSEDSENVKNVFSTLCDAVFTLPYVELFEGEVWEVGSYILDACWESNGSDAGYGYTVEQLGTSSVGTGPSGDNTTGFGKYVYAEASIGNNNETAELISPRVDLGASVAPFATYAYHMFGVTTNKLEVSISDDNGATWTTLETLTGEQQISEEDKWEQSQLSLAAYAGETIQLRFVSTKGADFTGDIAIDDVIITDSSLVDLSVGDITAPSSDCGLSSSEAVSISVSNSGYQTLALGTTIQLELSLNGSVVTTETLTLSSPLMPGASQDYTFIATLDIGSPGEYVVSVIATMTGDGIVGNNTRAKNVVNKPIISVYPYIQSFETGSDWTSGGAENSWALGTPAKSKIIGASDGTNAWVTGGLGQGTYNADEESFIEGPCFDFSNLEDPKIEFDIWWEIETIWEGATFQYSTDAGQNWSTLGSSNDADWFNSDTITTMPGIDGWTGTADGDDSFDGSEGWVTVKHDLAGLGENPQVFLRVFFKSDGFVAFDGIGIDNIKITGESLIPACYNDTVNLTTCDPNLAGTDVQVLMDVNDCDSIIITITELLTSYDITMDEKSCDKNDVGVEIMNLTTYQGCDSIITINTTLAPEYDITLNETSCDANDVGTVEMELTSQYGCDSMVTVITTLQDPYEVTINLESCNTSDTGTVVEVLTSTDGCDSTVTTITAYTPINADFTFDVNGPVATFTNASTYATTYAWDFGDGSASSSDANPSHTYTTDGTYTVELVASAAGCESSTVTKELLNVISSIDFISFIETINVYPNPSNGNFAVEIKGQSINKDLTFNLVDVRGKLIEVRSVDFNNYAKEVYQLDNLSNGVYFLTIQSDSEVTTLKINILR